MLLVNCPVQVRNRMIFPKRFKTVRETIKIPTEANEQQMRDAIQAIPQGLKESLRRGDRSPETAPAQA